MKIKGKLMFAFIGLSVISFVVIFIVTYRITRNVLNVEMENNLSNITVLSKYIAEEAYELNQDRVDHNINVANEFVDGVTALNEEQSIEFIAENQITGETTIIDIPTMYIGDEMVSKDTDFVDYLTEMIGGTVTVFQVVPQGLLRISTSVKKEDGTRAIGTYIPTSSEVYKTVMNGEMFSGRAFVVSDWYITAYKPIYSDDDEIIGVIYVGIKQANLNTLREKLLSIDVGETGYVYVIDSEGNIVIHPALERGENLYDSQDEDGNYFIREIVEEKQGSIIYPWKNETDRFARDKIVFFDYIEEMDWIIGTGSYLNEFFLPLNIIRNWLLVIFGIALLAVAIVTFLFSNNISNNLFQIVKQSQDIAEGDLDLQRLDFHTKDEMQILADSFWKMLESLKRKVDIIEQISAGNLDVESPIESQKDRLGFYLKHMIDALNNLLYQITLASSQVSTGSGQLSDASQSLSQGSSEQASAVEEISASVTELSNQSQENADNAGKANGFAKETRTHGEAGENMMGTLTQSITEIDKSSDEIRKIVKVIDDIAFQTNLLALNANVEAARAGKYGKGFAVVAEEVRNLAVRSANAVKETTEKVDEIIKSISYVDELSQDTSNKLKEIVKGSINVSEIVDLIANASKEQALGLEQMNEAIIQISDVTQSNTANAEETAAASEELDSQAKYLKEMVARFKIKNEDELEEAEKGSGKKKNNKNKEENRKQKEPEVLEANESSKNDKKTGMAMLPKDIIGLDEDDFSNF